MSEDRVGIEVQLEGFQLFLQQLRESQSEVNVLAERLEGITSTFNSLDKEVKDVDGSFDELDTKKVTSEFNTLRGGLDGIDATLNGTSQLFDDLSLALIDLIKPLQEAAASDVTGLQNSITEVVASIKELVSLGDTSDTIIDFANNLTTLFNALRKFVNGKQIAAFPARIKEITESLNVLFRDLDFSSFAKNIAPFAEIFSDLATVLANFTKVTKRDFSALIQEQKNLSKVTVAEAEQQLLAKRKQVAEERALAAKARKQTKVDNKFFIKTLEESRFALARYIASVRKARTEVTESLKVQLQVVGVQALAAVFEGPFRLAINAVGLMIRSLKQLSLTLISLPFRLITSGINSLRGVFGNLLSGILKVVSGFLTAGVNITKFLARISLLTTALNILTAPFRILLDILQKFGNLLGRLTGVGNLASQTDQAGKEASDAAQEFGDLNQEIAKLKQQDDIRLGFDDAAQSANKAGKSLKEVEASVKRIATVNVGNIFKGAQKDITRLALSFKGLDFALRGLDRLFQNARFAVQNLARDAFTASADFERLELSFTSLQQRELVQTGQFDNVNDALETARGNASELVQELEILAIQSPFGVEDIAQTFKLAQTYGFVTEEAKALTQVITDFTAGTGQSGEVGEGIIRALGQIRANSRLAKEELNQLAERGVPAIQILSDAAGLDTADFLAAVTDGAVDADFAVTALANALERDFGGAAARQTDTLAGLAATLQDLRKTALRLTFTPVLKSLQPLIQQFTSLDSILVIRDRFAAFGEVLAGRVTTAVANLIGGIKALINIWKALPDETRDNIKQFAQFAATMIATTVAVASLQFVLQGVFLALGAIINPITLAVSTFVTFRTQIMSFGSTLLTTFRDVQASIQQVVRDFRDGFRAVDYETNAMVTSVAMQVGQLVRTMYDFGVNVGTEFARGIIAAAKAVISAVRSLVAPIIGLLRPGSPPAAIPNIDKWGTAAAQEFLDGFTEADFSSISDFGNTIEDLVEAINIEPGAVDVSGIVSSFSDLINNLDGNVPSSSAITDFLQSVQEEAGEFGAEFNIVAEEFAALAVEQQKLESLQGRFNDQLKTTNAELDSLANADAFAEEEKQLQSLNNVLTNQFASEAAQEAARRKIATIEAQRKKREIEAQEAAVGAQKENIDLIRERLGLASRFGEEDSASTLSGGGLGSSLDGLDAAKEKVDELGASFEDLSDLTELAELGKGAGSLGLENIGDGLTTFQEDVATATTAITKRILDLRRKIEGFVEKIKGQEGKIRAFATTLGLLFVAPRIIASIRTVSLILTAIGKIAGIATVGKAVGVLGAGLGALVSIPGILTIGAIAGSLALLGKLEVTSLADAGTKIKQFGADIQEGFVTDSGEGFTGIKDFAEQFTNFDATEFATNLGATFATLKTSISTQFADFRKSVSEGFSGGEEDVGGLGISSLVSAEEEGTLITNTGVALGRIGANIATSVQTNIITPFTTAFDGVFDPGDINFGNIIAAYITGLANVYTAITEDIGVNARAAIESGFGTAIEDITFEGLTESLGAIGTTIADALNLDAIGIAISGIFDNFSIDFTPITNFFDIFDRLTGLSTSFDEFATSLASSDLFNQLTTLGLNLAQLAGKILVLVGAVLVLVGGPILGQLPTLLGGLLQFVSGIVGVVDNFIDLIATALRGGDIGAAGEELIQSVFDIFLGIGTFFTGVILAIGQFVANILELFGLDGAVERFQESREKILGQLEALKTLFTAENYAAAVRGFVSGIGDAIAGITAPFTSAFDGLEIVLDALFANIAPLFETGGGALIKALTDRILLDLLGFATAVGAGLKLALETIFGEDAVAPIIEFATSLVTLFTTSFQDIKTALESGNPFLILKETIQAVIDVFALVTEPITTFFTNLTGITVPNIFTLLSESIDTVITAVQNAITKFGEYVTFQDGLILIDVFGLVSDGVKSLTELIGNLITEFTTGATIIGQLVIVNPLLAITEKIVELLDIVGIDLTGQFETFRTFMEGLTFTDVFVPITLAIQLVQSVLGLLTGDTTGFQTFLSKLLLANPFKVVENGINAVITIIATVTSKLDEFKTFVSGLDLNPFDDIEIDPNSGLLGAINQLPGVNIGQDLAKDVATGFEEGVQSAELVTPEIELDEVAAQEEGRVIGAAIIDGTQAGIDEGVGEAEESAEGANKTIKDKFLSFWGIESPSTVANEEIGVPIAEGIIEGISAGVSGEGETDIGTTLFDAIEASVEEQVESRSQGIGATIIQAITDALSQNNTQEEGSLVDSLIPLDEASFQGITNSFTALFDGLIELLENFIDDFDELLEEWYEELIENLEELVENVLEIVQDMFSKIIEFLVAFSIQFITLLNLFLSQVETTMRRFKSIMEKAAEEGFDAFIEVFDDFGEAFSNKINEQLVSIEEGLVKEMEAFGIKIADAFVDAIIERLASRYDDLYAAGFSAAAAANQGAKDGAQIASPSKIWAGFGDAMVDGMVNSLNNGRTRLKNTAKSVLNSANSVFEKIVNSGSSGTINSGRIDQISAMQGAASGSVITNNNYTMNMSVREGLAPKTARNFSKMQSKRAIL